MQYFEPSNKNFKSNGDIKINPYGAKLRVELNTGNNEIEVNIPYDQEGKWKYIKELGVIKTDVFYSLNKQLYRIYSIEKGIMGMNVRARHILFDLVNKAIVNLKLDNLNGAEALEKILSATNVKYKTDIALIKNSEYINTNVIEALNGSNQNSFRNVWGGEFLLDDDTIIINSHIGEDKGIKVTYGKNIEDVSLNINTDNIITRVYPVAYNNIMLPEKFIDSPFIKKYPIVAENFLKMEDYRLRTGDEIEESENETYFDNKEDLFVAMRERVKKAYEKGMDIPTISGNIKIKDLSNTLEYKNFKNLEKANIGDTITVVHKSIGVNIKTRIISCTWDIITKEFLDQEFGEVDIGYFNRIDQARETLENILLGDNVNAEKIIGVLKTVLITNKDDSFQIDLRSSGGAMFKNNGQPAMEMRNNSLNFFNWGRSGDFIGGLSSFIRGNDIDKPVIGLFNDTDSAISISYKKNEAPNTPYITFDKYNSLGGTDSKPITIYESVDFWGNKVYNLKICSPNGNNTISVSDDMISMDMTNNQVVISKNTIRLGKGNTKYASLDTVSGDLTIQGNLRNAYGAILVDQTGGSSPGTGGSNNDMGDVSKGIPSRKYYRYLKGIEGFQQYPGNIGDGQITYGYGVTKANEPDFFARLGDPPCSEETASKVLFDLIPARYGNLVKNQMLKDGLDLKKVPQNVFDAFVDLCYNTGYYNSRLYKAWKNGESLQSIYNDWLTYVIMPGSIFEEGLRRRRKEEAEMFKNGVYVADTINILNANGSSIGTVKGDGYFPPLPKPPSNGTPPPNTDGLMRVNNDYGTGWIVPVTGCRITAGFPTYPSGGRHDGMDFGCNIGTPVRVSKDGKVIKRREITTSYGKYIFVDHGSGLVTIYAHNSELLVNEGDYVKAGQIIAKSGNTGNSTGPHLHWELRVNGVPKDVAPSLHTGDYV